MADNYTVQIDLEIIDAEETEMILEKFTGTDGKDGKSAYQYAVEHGYTGTEEEFAEYMANAAEYSEHIQETVDDAIQDALDSGDFVPDMEIGTVQTVPHGQSASATITGTKSNPVLNLNIPQGASGNETIDDTAGFGDDDLVWSADKTLKEVDSKADAICKTIDTPASIITIEDGADDLPVKEMQIAIEPVQEGTGDPSPENVRPITGRTGCNVTRTGKNLYNIDGTNTSNGYEDGKILKSTGNAEATGSLRYWCITEYIRVEPSTTYTISGMRNLSASGTIYCCQYDENKHFVQSVDQSFASITFTTGSNVKFVRLTIEKSQMATVQIEKGSVVSAYESFGDVYSITFPSSAGTVYGGNLTIHADRTGDLVVDRTGLIDLSTLNWDTQKSYGDFKLYTVRNEAWTWNKETDAVVANALQYVVYSNGYFNPTAETVLNFADKTITIVDTRRLYAWSAKPTVAEFKQYLSDIGAVASIRRNKNTAIEYQLSVPQVRTLLGLNHIWADTGDIESITYPVDTATELNNQTTTTRGMIAGSDSPVATESHAVGDVFICGNKMIRATDAIAVGESVIIGSNAEAINLADYIREVATQAQTNHDLIEDTNLSVSALQGLSVIGADQYGEDADVTDTGRRITRKGNQFSISYVSASTSYKYFNLFGDINIVSSGTIPVSYSDSLPFPEIPNSDMTLYAIVRYKRHVLADETANNASTIYAVLINEDESRVDAGGCRLANGATDLQDGFGIACFNLGKDSTKRINFTFTSRHTRTEYDFIITFIALPDNQ